MNEEQLDLYDGAYSGQQIDEALNAFNNPDTVPTPESDALITSGAIAAWETEKNAELEAFGEQIAEIQQQVASPFEIAATAADMVDTAKAYVYVGATGGGFTNGAWYYYDGSAWVQGGAAVDATLTVSGAPADAKTVGDVTRVESKSLKSLITTPGEIYYSDGTDKNTTTALTSFKRSDYIAVRQGDFISFSVVRAYSTDALIAFYDASYSYDASLSVIGMNATQYGSLSITSNGYIRLCCRNTELSGDGDFILYSAIGSKFNTLIQTGKALHASMAKSNFLLLTVAEILKHPNTTIRSDSGAVVSTSRDTGTTDYYPCEPGDVLSYKLSADTGLVILATYDENFKLLRCPVIGAGVSSYLESTYTFQSDERYFIISAKTPQTYYSNYYLKYSTTVTVLTEMDARITALEDGNASLPSYWVTYLNSKIPVLREKDALIGSGGDSFVFITDVHYERNSLLSPNIIRNIIKNTTVNTVFCGGDIIDLGDTEEDAIEMMANWQSLFFGLRDFNIIGNHDGNNYNSSQPTEALTKGQYYGTMTKPAEQWINTNGEIYYCVDNESQKIRYICLALEVFDNVGTSGTQHDWLQTKLTEKGSDWTVLILQHRIWGSDTSDLDTKCKNVMKAIDEVYSNIQAKFVGIIAGHTHLDNDAKDSDYSVTTTTHGYLLIATNCDAHTGENSGYTRTVGTTNEHSFDVFYIDKTNEKLYAVRIGAGDTVVGSGTGIREFSYGS